MENNLMDKELEALILKHKPDFNLLPGGVRINASLDLDQIISTSTDLYFVNDEASYIRNFMSTKNCDELIDIFQQFGKYSPVTIQGLQEVNDDTIGSQRITGFSPELAEQIYESLWLNNSIPRVKKTQRGTPTDHYQEPSGHIWEFCGVSPMLRFMKYEKGGLHYPHYDAGFLYPNSEYRTLKSFVLYLTTNNSGATRFIDDAQYGVETKYRDHSDWSREPYKSEIIESVLPVKGDMLVFDHRMCHDVSTFNDPFGDRIIIRGDLIYKRIK